MASDNNITSETTREYLDNFSVKKHAIEVISPKYFSEDMDLSYLNVGLQGFATEMIAQTAEDAFNTASVLMRESFPILAQIPESIYSHAAIFQMSNAFGNAAYGNFYLAIDQQNLIDNFVTKNGINHFYIDKDTTVMVDGIPFVLDYDIDIRAIRRESITKSVRSSYDKEKYIFSAMYMMDESPNSISTIKNPYIRVRAYSGDYNTLILNVVMRQCTRDVTYETLTTNETINYPVINVPFSGTLAGFDVLYRKPNETEFNTVLEKKVAYSLPTKTPFCYYKLKDEQTLQIFFTSRDSYFQPRFNSELKIVTYTCMGSKGNFTTYSGDDLVVHTNTDRYSNNVSFAISARPIAGVSDGADQTSLEALQAFTVEGFSTANALTTEPDLDIHFRNYKYRYLGDINWIKKRDDVFERLYGCYIVMKKDDYIYPTNTLHLKCNLDDMTQMSDKTRYVLEPGHLFTYADDSTDTVVLVKDPDKEKAFKEEYSNYIKEHPYAYPDTPQDELPEWKRGPISYESWMQTIKKEHDSLYITDDNALDKFQEGEFEEHIKTECSHGCTSEGDDPCDCGCTETVIKGYKFVYTNPFLMIYTKDPGMIGCYLTQVSQSIDIDFIWQNDNAFIQWNIAAISISRILEKEKRYHITIQTTANIDSLSGTLFEEPIKTKTGFNDKANCINNSLRLFATIQDKSREVVYFELIPTTKNADGIYTFEAYIYTDDHITSNSNIRLYEKKDDPLSPKIGNMGALSIPLIPIDNAIINIYPMFNGNFAESLDAGHIPKFKAYVVDEEKKNGDSTFDKYYPTNVYSTISDPVTFIKPLNNVRCHMAFEDYLQNALIKLGDCIVRSVPFVKYSMLVKDDTKDDWEYFLASFLKHYEYMNKIIIEELRNVSHIDMKFYNSYGKSKNYMIGEEDETEIISTVTPKIYFDIWVSQTTDIVTAERDLKVAIKDYIESINSNSGANLFISNLMHFIEDKYAYVDHMRFRGICDYATTYQAVTNTTPDASTLTRDERRYYVPEILNVPLEYIYLTMYKL